MKKTLLKALSSTLALALVATAGIGAAPKADIPAEEINAKPAQVETVKETTVLDLVEEKIQEDKAIEVKVVTAETAAPAEKAAEPQKAAEEIAAPEVKAPEAVIENEAAAPEVKAEETVAPEVEAEPDMVWDISATASDNVAMEFYAEPAETTATEQVEIDVQTGTVYISGEGVMEEAVYNHFMTVERYLAATKAAYKEYYGVEVEALYDDTITDVKELDMTVKFYNPETYERLYPTLEMFESLNPDAFLEYSPKKIVIEEGITNVSDEAFIFCGDLETVVLPSTIESIGKCAFEHCDSLKTIVIPENAEIGNGAFNYCDSLENIYLANAEYYANNGASAPADGEIAGLRAMDAEKVNNYVHYYCN